MVLAEGEEVEEKISLNNQNEIGCTKRELRAAEMTSKMKPNVVSSRSEKRRGESQSRLPPSISPALYSLLTSTKMAQPQNGGIDVGSLDLHQVSPSSTFYCRREHLSQSLSSIPLIPFSHDSYQTSDLNSHRNWNI